MPNCNRDLGWQTPIDVPVFLLKQWMPSWLTFVQTASNFPFPLNALVASQTLQAWLHRWDNVDLSTDPVAYSQQWTCAIGVELIPTIVLLYTLAILLTFEPTRALAKAVLLFFAWIVSAAGFLAFGFLFGWMGLAITLPMRAMKARLD